MRLGRTKFASFLLCFSLACTVPPLLAKKKDKASLRRQTISGAPCTRSIA